MGILTVVVDSRGALVPYLEIMEQLQHEGIEGLTYVYDDLRAYVENLDAPTIVDRFNLAQFSTGNAVFESSDNALALMLATRQVFKIWLPSAMRTIAEAAEAGRFVPGETVVVANSLGLLLLGHFCLALGIKAFVCVDPYRMVDWKDIWQRDRSQFTPNILPKNLSAQFFRLLLAGLGKQKTEEFFGHPVPYDYSTIKAAVKMQLHMYSPQLADDQNLACGYPYPVTTGRLDNDLADFIATQRQQGNRIIAFTIGSMDINQARKDYLIEQFIAGLHSMGDAAGVILGYGPMTDTAVFSTLNFVPYIDLFSQVDLVVTHGGAGTTHMALVTGTPVFNIPFVKDQYEWAGRLDNLGMRVGIAPQKQFTAERFVNAVMNNFTDHLVAAAHRAGETERSKYNNPRALLDPMIKVAETVRTFERRA